MDEPIEEVNIPTPTKESGDPMELRKRGNEEEDGIDSISEAHSGDQLLHASWQRKLYVKIGYGLGEAGCYILSAINGFFLGTFLLEVAQVPATQSGIIILLSEMFDAITDPLVGKLSDETRTPWGRRRPWIFVGAFPLCLFFWLFFLVPPLTGYLLVAYYIILALGMKLSYAAVVSLLFIVIGK